MQLSKYISDLLYRYECVMVPNFGGFVSNTVSSQLDEVTQQFTPPTKNISFNIHLQQNDGLLINHIAKSLNISYDEASKLIQNTIDNWNADLQESPLLLNNIGQFTLENEQLNFEPINSVNYLASSFGLSDVDVNYVLRHSVATTNVAVDEPDNDKVEEPVLAPKKTYTKYIAAAAIFAGVFIAGNTYINSLVHKQEIVAQQEITTKIQQASFNVLSPLPAITVLIEKKEIEVETPSVPEITHYKYHIIAGAFKDAENAAKKVAHLTKKGYDPKIIGLNKWGLTQVSYASFNDKNEATNMLNSIRNKDNKHAWLFINP